MRRRAIILTLLLAAACGGEDSPSSGAHGVGVPGDDAGTGVDTTTPVVPLRVIVTEEAGVDVPWLVPVGPDGAGAPIALGPRRGAGYGGGEGTVSYPQLTPDGSTVVALFTPLEGPGELYALPTDGSGVAAPVAIAQVSALSALDRAYDAGRVAYVDGGDLYVAPLDGGAAPVLVARSGQGAVLEGPRFVPGGERLAFVRTEQPGGARQVRAALLDGTEAEAPPVIGGAAPLERLAGVLASGGVLGYGADDRLYAAPAAGGDAAPLTPEGWLASLVGVSTDGARAVVSLRTTWSDGRELVSVATDGSDAATPVKLTVDLTEDLEAVVSTDGQRAAWAGKGAAGQWAVYEGPVAPVGLDAPRRITAWAAERLHVTDYVATAGALVGANESGAVLRFPLPGGEQTQPVVLHVVADVVNWSNPWPRLSTDGAQVLFDANTATGWKSWVLPLSGGAPVEHPGAWYRDLVTPHGIILDEPVTLGALVAVEPHGPATALTAWHEAPILDAYVSADDAWVVYACEAPVAGWYAARTDTVGPAEPGASPGGAVLLRGADAQDSWWSIRPLYVDGTLLRRAGDVVEAVRLGEEAGVSSPLLTGVTGAPVVHAPTGRVVAPQGGRVVSAPAAGGEPTVVLDAGAPVTGLVVLPTGDRVLAVVQPGGGALLLAAAVDGSEASAPLAVGAELPGWLLSVTPTADGARVLSEHSVEATAIPHPDVLLTSTVGGAAPGTAELTHAPFVRWGGEGDALSTPTEAPPLVITTDGAHVVLQGPDGLYSARTDGSETSPKLLGPATRSVGAGLGPDGRTVLAAGDGTLTAAVAGQVGSQRSLVEMLAQPVAEALFAAGGTVLIRTGDPGGATGALLSVALGGGEAVELLPQGSSGALVSTGPGGEALVATVGEVDRGLFLVPATPGQEVERLTAQDDAGETFVGWTGR